MTRGLLAVVAVALFGLTQAQPPISIGLVRQDGYLVPIAAITPKLFDPPHEQPEWRFKDLRWTVSSGGGRKPFEIRTIEPVTVRSPCSEPFETVWRTTLKRPPVPEYVAPIPKIGVAISGGAIEHPEDVVHQPDAASRRVARRIVQLTHAKEFERIASEPTENRSRGQTPAERAKVSVRLRQLRRHSTSSVSTYYFEATKAWGLEIDRGLVTGWIVVTPSGLTDHDVKYKFNDDSSKENDRAIVWGVVRYLGRTLWILEWHGYESEYYNLHEWPSGIERSASGGWSC